MRSLWCLRGCRSKAGLVVQHVAALAQSVDSSLASQDFSREGHQGPTCSHVHNTKGRSHSRQHCQNVSTRTCLKLAETAPSFSMPWTYCRQLHRDNRVNFAGYKVPHPLEYRMLIKVQSGKERCDCKISHSLFSKHKSDVYALLILLCCAATGSDQWRM